MKKRFVQIAVVATALTMGCIAAPEAKAALEPSNCSYVSPSRPGSTQAIKCSFRDTFQRNGYWWHRNGTIIMEYLPHSGGWLITYGKGYLYLWLSSQSRWDSAACQYYDYAARDWLTTPTCDY